VVVAPRAAGQDGQRGIGPIATFDGGEAGLSNVLPMQKVARRRRNPLPIAGTIPGNAWARPKRSPPRLIYCTVLARSAKLPTPPWPPAMRSIWMPIFWTPFTSAVVPGLAGGICGAGLQMSVTKPSFASGM